MGKKGGSSHIKSGATNQARGIGCSVGGDYQTLALASFGDSREAYELHSALSAKSKSRIRERTHDSFSQDVKLDIPSVEDVDIHVSVLHSFRNTQASQCGLLYRMLPVLHSVAYEVIEH